MKHQRLLVCASLLAGLTPFGHAQSAPQDPTTTTIQVKTTKLKRVGGDIVGQALVTPKNEPLGKVEDVVIHPSGALAFVEVSGTGALQTGSKRFSIPWRALECNENGQFVIATTPEAFVKFPSYEKRPALTDLDWWTTNEKRYEKVMTAKATPVEAAAALAPAKSLYLGSDLRARTIEDPQGTKIATMSEVVVDPRAQRVAYVVLSVGGNAGAGNKSIAVPWEALKSMPDKTNPKIERLTLATTKEKLEQAPAFEATSAGWTAACEPGYVVSVYEHYSVPR